MAAPIGGKTQLTGLIGWPVSHSLSPAMHNAAAAALGLDLVYLPLAVRPDQLAAAVRGLAALGFHGANVTVPHKEAVTPLLDTVDPAAAAIGAVNTIVISGQWSVVSGQQSAFSLQPSPDPRSPLLTGYNTDYSGFLADLEQQGGDVTVRECLILGAGGSARAVAYGLAMAGGRAHIFARREAQAQQLVAGLADHCPAGSLTAHAWSELGQAKARFPETALIVNTTPLGMTPDVDRSPWPESAPLPGRAFVYDLVYNPAETRLMGQARAAGLKASNGLGMLLRQGALAFQLWTGLQPDLAIMAQALQSDP
jgi:shikimate dehydrogenase